VNKGGGEVTYPAIIHDKRPMSHMRMTSASGSSILETDAQTSGEGGVFFIDGIKVELHASTVRRSDMTKEG